MKKLLTIIAILTLLLPEINAQDNVAKVGVVGLSYGRINLNYERVLTDKMSINVQAGVQIPRQINTIFTGPTNHEVMGTRWNAFGITPHLRFYPKNEAGAPRGFYYGPYLTHNSNRLKFDFEDTENDRHQSETVINLAGTGLGFSIGTQWFIGDRISIDWNYFGLGLAYKAYKFDYASKDPNVDYEKIEEDFQREFSGGPLFGYHFKTEITENGISGKSKKIGPIFRSSITIGYAF